MLTEDNIFWPIPITLSAEDDIASGITIGDDVALVGVMSFMEL